MAPFTRRRRWDAAATLPLSCQTGCRGTSRRRRRRECSASRRRPSHPVRVGGVDDFHERKAVEVRAALDERSEGDRVLAALIVGGSRPRRLNGRLLSCVPIAAAAGPARKRNCSRRLNPTTRSAVLGRPPRSGSRESFPAIDGAFRGRSRSRVRARGGGGQTSPAPAPSEAGAASRPTTAT